MYHYIRISSLHLYRQLRQLIVSYKIRLYLQLDYRVPPVSIVNRLQCTGFRHSRCTLLPMKVLAQYCPRLYVRGFTELERFLFNHHWLIWRNFTSYTRHVSSSFLFFNIIKKRLFNAFKCKPFIWFFIYISIYMWKFNAKKFFTVVFALFHRVE